MRESHLNTHTSGIWSRVRPTLAVFLLYFRLVFSWPTPQGRRVAFLEKKTNHSTYWGCQGNQGHWMPFTLACDNPKHKQGHLLLILLSYKFDYVVCMFPEEKSFIKKEHLAFILNQQARKGLQKPVSSWCITAGKKAQSASGSAQPEK